MTVDSFAKLDFGTFLTLLISLWVVIVTTPILLSSLGAAQILPQLMVRYQIIFFFTDDAALFALGLKFEAVHTGS